MLPSTLRTLGLYRLRYLPYRWSRRPARGHPALDVAYVVAAANRGWILDRTARELARAHRERRVDVVFSDRAYPRSRIAFYLHPKLFLDALAMRVHAADHAVVHVTHVVPGDTYLAELVHGLRFADLVICNNSPARAALEAAGFPSGVLHCVPGGGDPDRFRPPARPRAVRRVLLCSAYYPRKSPERLLALARACPGERFRLIGRGWDACREFQDLQRLPNFEYLETDYERYPALFAECDRFLSLSRVEGGPIPLVEAMFSDLVPVVSATGFAPDLIRHGRNGFVFPVDAPLEHVRDLLGRACELEGSVRETVMGYSWERVCGRMTELMEPLLGHVERRSDA